MKKIISGLCENVLNGLSASSSTVSKKTLPLVSRTLQPPRTDVHRTDAHLSRPYKNKQNLDFVLSARSRFREVQHNKAVVSNSWNTNSYPSKFINFYDQKLISPYTPVLAKGPWILTDKNTVIYDTGGYGMLGFGHNDDEISSVLSKPQVMANILTPNQSQNRFTEAIDKHAGMYNGFMALNSGSETNELAFRIADTHFKTNQSDKEPVIVVLDGSFHGRTYLSGQASTSCTDKYKKYLSSFNRFFPTYRMKINNLVDVKNVFETIRKNNQAPLLTLMEPVMGEGNPGIMIRPDFYHAVREETRRMGSLLHIDSVQAGIRTTGNLSVTRYDGFNMNNDTMPDMEVFSKALNGGQFPLSVLAVKDRSLYKIGIYGNTMTANPRGLDVGTSVLDRLTPELKTNIVTMGAQLKDRLLDLQREFPQIVDDITGTGLLLAIHLNEKYSMYDVEQEIRMNGLNLIHGGKNALRLTPWFKIDEHEIELIHAVIRKVFLEMN